MQHCNCSFYDMCGAVVASADLSGIEVLQGQDALTLCQFNTKHFFCKHCGIHPFHQRRAL